MSCEFLNKIQECLKIQLFTDNDLKLIFPEKDHSAIYNSLAYHLKKKNVERFKRGLYSLSPQRGKQYSFSKFKLANKMVLHSFISFESALSHHGLIPEAVYEISSASLNKNLLFENSLGRFTYTFSPIELFYLGVEKDETTDAKIANPMRALFDLVYIRRKLYQKSEDLDNDLRIDLAELKKYLSHFKPRDILELGDLYQKKTTKKLATILVRDLL
jgi:hypothetical protein